MRIAKIRDVKTPTRATLKAAGLDFYVPNDFKEVYINPGQSVNIPSGIVAEIPEGYALLAVNKSGVAFRNNLQVGACLIDGDYQGEIHLHVTNVGENPTNIFPEMKILQFVLLPVFPFDIEQVYFNDLFNSVSERGNNGFGSTNK